MRKVMAVILTMVFTVTGVLSIGADTDYVLRNGTIDGYSYTLSLKGDTQDLSASTYYAGSGTRSVTLYAEFIGEDFVGTDYKRVSNGYYTGTVSAMVSVSYDERFVSADTTYTLAGFTTEYTGTTIK